MIYLNHAASHFPVDGDLFTSLQAYFQRPHLSHGRSAGEDQQPEFGSAASTRLAVARFLGLGTEQADSVILNSGCTESLNTLINSFINRWPDSPRVVDSTSHNAVRRCLHARDSAEPPAAHRTFDKQTFYIENLPALPALCVEQFVNQIETTIEEAAKACPTDGPILLVLTPKSNVVGFRYELDFLDTLRKEHNLFVIVDGAQEFAVYNPRLDLHRVDGWAFCGHKAARGLAGSGGFYLADPTAALPLISGGTGTDSLSAQMPAEGPLRFEAGTRNLAGIFSLDYGLQQISQSGLEAATQAVHEKTLYLIEELYRLKSRLDVHFYPANLYEHRQQLTGPFIVNFGDWDSIESASMLHSMFDIHLRDGLHCAPGAHRLAGSPDSGAVRISPGNTNTEAELESFIESLQTAFA